MKKHFAEEEEVVEETTTEETVEEGGPDAHGQFVQLLEDMGLSAEQAEAIHQMAMDLVNNAPAEGSNEGERVEASRARRRNYSGRSGRSGRPGRSKMGGSRRRGMSRSERPVGRREFSRNLGGRREFSDVERLERTVARQRRQLAKMQEQLEGMGQRPGSDRLNSAPNVNLTQQAQFTAPQGSVKARVFEMMKSAL